MEEKRTQPRICTAFTAKCTELPEQKNIFYTAIKDLSPGGLQIFCSKKIPRGTSFYININLINECAETKAQVAWNDKKPNSDLYCVGLKFLEVNRKNKHKIDNFFDAIFLNTVYYSCNCSDIQR
ncbi:MAG: PilZ domain-containing protein [Spirochaetota bacterium]